MIIVNIGYKLLSLLPSIKDIMSFELVLFDCDGVLVDSEMISARAFSQVLNQVGVKMSPEQVFTQFKGGSMAQSIAYVEDILGGPAPIDIEKIYRQLSFDMYQSEMTAVEGVETILKHLTISKCVASNAPRNKIKLNLELTSLDKYFEDGEIFSAYDFDAWKPDPTMFLSAALRYGIAPEHCLVIGDSIADAQGAFNAGMSCFAYAPNGDLEGLEKAGATIYSKMSNIALALDPYLRRSDS